MDREEMKKAFETVEEIKLEILKFVKDFFENTKPVLFVGEEGNFEFNEVEGLEAELETKKFGKLQIYLYENEENEDEWEYYVIALDMGNTLISINEFDEPVVATGDLIFAMKTTPPKMLTSIVSYKKAKFYSFEDRNCIDDDVK